MRALVVYESLFGNTHAIAEAIAEGLRTGLEVGVATVDDATPDRVLGVDLLVVGGPTHVHGMDWHGTRAMGARSEHDKEARGEEHHELDEAAAGESLRRWFHDLRDGRGEMAAAFDTRFDRSAALTGSAARGIARRLRHHGYDVVVDTASFFVDADQELVEGEPDRARAWGRALAARLVVGVEPTRGT